jgi:hypothetical protein
VRAYALALLKVLHGLGEAISTSVDMTAGRLPGKWWRPALAGLAYMP